MRQRSAPPLEGARGELLSLEMVPHVASISYVAYLALCSAWLRPLTLN